MPKKFNKITSWVKGEARIRENFKKINNWYGKGTS